MNNLTKNDLLNYKYNLSNKNTHYIRTIIRDNGYYYKKIFNKLIDKLVKPEFNKEDTLREIKKFITNSKTDKLLNLLKNYNDLDDNEFDDLIILFNGYYTINQKGVILTILDKDFITFVETNFDILISKYLDKKIGHIDYIVEDRINVNRIRFLEQHNYNFNEEVIIQKRY